MQRYSSIGIVNYVVRDSDFELVAGARLYRWTGELVCRIISGDPDNSLSACSFVPLMK